MLLINTNIFWIIELPFCQDKIEELHNDQEFSSLYFHSKVFLQPVTSYLSLPAADTST